LVDLWLVCARFTFRGTMIRLPSPSANDEGAMYGDIVDDCDGATSDEVDDDGDGATGNDDDDGDGHRRTSTTTMTMTTTPAR